MTTNKVYAIRIKKWIDALRSGGYSKCTGQYHYGEKHCVIGIGELVANRGAMSCTGLEQFYGHSSTHTARLIRMNDDTRATFKQMAAWIEKNILTKYVPAGKIKS